VRYNERVDYSDSRPIGDILRGRDAVLKEQRNIILKNADAATAKGFTMVPNFILKSTKLSAGDKMTFAMLLSYAWQRDFCYPGQKRLGEDLGLTDRSVRTHLKSLEAIGLLAIRRLGQGKNNVYELDLKPRRL
jgi:DNA-binding MarR family transcriptional regulator